MIPVRYKNSFPSSEIIDNPLDYEDGNGVSSKERKGHMLWKKVKYQLVEYHSLPWYLRDNEFIHGYYRAEWPLKQVLLSIFKIHNETLNVWTSSKVQDGYKASLLSMEFLSTLSGNIMERLTNCLIDRFTRMYHVVDDSVLQQGVKDDVSNMIAPLMFHPITRWPFFLFLGGAMFCLLASSTCHLLSCHSERMSYIVHRIDYAGIAALIATSFYPPVYYSFMCNPFFCNLYLGFITLLGIATIVFSLLPVFQRPELRGFRAGLFFGMGMSGVAPILHKLILYKDQPEALQTTGYEILMGILYGLGALIYATRIPERWKPGKFDIAGHSHQLFHILVVAGAYTHYQAGLVYLRWRDLHGC
ncbi:hypothetical protein GH714_011324 [Hevea brasiliensis]|uniref:Uncharacterized protein n=1 Tax=Hevea brasiliensis TaxID=3981 RepID=A0A6A6NGI3_HEVBR|nr:hypothetical protein GH714_011324 [Hevea brasiliensis]